MEAVRHLIVRVSDASADPEELAELTASLRRELLDLDVAVAPVPGEPAPPGVRAVEPISLGALLLTLSQSAVLAAIINAVATWLGRRQDRSIKLELDGEVLEMTGTPTAQQRELAEAWLRRHQGDAAPVTGNRSALIVASYDYQDPGLRQLRAPARDAEELASVLGEPRIGGFTVRTLLNEPAPVVNEAIEEFFADRDPDDLLLLHFSCHGVKDDSGDLYFAGADTKLNRLGATSTAADFVNRRMTRSRSRRIVLLLDCCYAGAFGRGMVARAGGGINIQEQFGGRGRAVITSSNAMEYAFEGVNLADDQAPEPSVFTSALVDGLRTGDADRDQDGLVSLDELYDYLYDRVRSVTPQQTPGKWTFGVQGDLFIAKRGGPVSQPTPLPAELREAIASPLAGIRAGTVAELGRLLHGGHPGLAYAAKLALERLAADDSRAVSTAATSLLEPPAQPDPPAAPARTIERPATVDPPAGRVATVDPPARQSTVEPPVDSTVDLDADVATPSESADVAAEESIVDPPEPIRDPRPAVTGRLVETAQSPASSRLAMLARVVALMAVPLLLIAYNLPLGTPTSRATGAHLEQLYTEPILWYWLLIAAAVVFGLAPDGRRERAVAHGALFGCGAGLAGLVIVVNAMPGIVQRPGHTIGYNVLAVGVGLVLVAASVEALRICTEPWRLLGVAATVVALAMLAVLAIVEISDEEALVPTVLGLTLLAAFLVRTVLRWRRPDRFAVGLLAAGTLLTIAAAASALLSGVAGGRLAVERAAAGSIPAAVVVLLLGVLAARTQPVLLVTASLLLLAGMAVEVTRILPRAPVPNLDDGGWLIRPLLLTAAAACVLVAVRLPVRRLQRGGTGR